jgi:esterase/lipase superfamily enzyme
MATRNTTKRGHRYDIHFVTNRNKREAWVFFGPYSFNLTHMSVSQAEEKYEKLLQLQLLDQIK